MSKIRTVVTGVFIAILLAGMVITIGNPINLPGIILLGVGVIGAAISGWPYWKTLLVEWRKIK